MRELPVPSVAESDPNARELARVWAAGGRQHVSLATGLWADPGAWGLLLVDLARHVARAHEQTEGQDASVVLNRIREALEAEWDAPTDEPSGSV
ncbi:MAG: DUF5076 domain-containing protein [Acidobacteriota bacterium]